MKYFFPGFYIYIYIYIYIYKYIYIYIYIYIHINYVYNKYTYNFIYQEKRLCLASSSRVARDGPYPVSLREIKS